MKGIYFDGEKAVYRENWEKPKPEKTESLVRILMSGVCNTDKEILKGYRPDFRGIMGHEFVGVVEESEDSSLIGKRVVGEINAGCGTCGYCRSGLEKHCETRRTLGMSCDGCFAEYMVIENHLLHEVPADLPVERAVFTEPLAAALEILSQVHIGPEAEVALIGDGRLALMTAEVLALTGCHLTVVGRHEEKLELFKAYGDTTLEPSGRYDVVVETSGSPSGFESAMKLVKRRGTIVLKSTYSGKPQVDMATVVVNEITVAGSRCGPFEPALRLLASGRVKFPPVQQFELKEYEEAFHSPAFKAVFLISKE